MAVLPTNEKLLLMEGDDEAWVDTHHGLGESQWASHCCVLHDSLTQLWSRLRTN